jgi:tetratricopeptide (TPR) repeat protein
MKAFSRALLFAALLGTTLAAYQPAWHGGVLWDDDGHMTPVELRSVDGLRRIWFDVGATQQYYPVAHSAFWVLHRISGDDTLAYHLTNIVLHALSALLIAVILRRLRVPGAELAALIFALHPVQVESVAWITELKNTLSGVLYFGAALVYLHFDERRRRWLYALAAVLFTLALLSKSVTASLPAALLIVFWWQRGRLDWRRDVLPLAPFFVVGAAGGLLTAWVERTLIGAHGTEFQFTLIERCLIAGRAIWFYLGTLIWPATLIFTYPRWAISQGVWWQYVYPLGAAGLLAACWRWRLKTRAPLAALLFFIVTLAPALGFVNVYPFRFSLVADHFQYLASLGIITLAAAAVTTLVRRRAGHGTSVQVAVAVAIALPLAWLTWQQAHLYANAETLYRATIARNPAAWMAYHNLGVLELHGPAEQVNDAASLISESLRINPSNPEAHDSLGFALQRLGRMDEARTQYDAAIRLQPSLAEAYNNLGTLEQAEGHLEEAVARYANALRINPRYPTAQRNLGVALQDLGRLDEAFPHLEAALRLDRNTGKAVDVDEDALGTAWLRRGRADEAIVHYREAVRIDPGFAEARSNLGSALERIGRTDEAVAEYREAIRIKPGAIKARVNLGYVLARTGKRDEALAQLREAVRLQPDDGRAHYYLANTLQSMNRLTEALAEYKDALAHTEGPSAADVHNDYGVALAMAGRMNEARNEFREALRINPDFADAKANLKRAGG